MDTIVGTSSYGGLAYGDPWDYVPHDRIEKYADHIVAESPLINRVAKGDLGAVKVFMVGFWPFVKPFGSGIYEFRPPFNLLYANLGRERGRSLVRTMSAQFEQMSEEEGQHAELWRRDATDVGIEDLKLASEQMGIAPGVEELVTRSRSRDPLTRLFLLGGTEAMAEALSRRLARRSPKFTSLFPSHKWSWGEAHLEAHDGPSHWQMDVDLARACMPTGTSAEWAATVIEQEHQVVLHLFDRAAIEVLALANQ